MLTVKIRRKYKNALYMYGVELKPISFFVLISFIVTHKIQHFARSFVFGNCLCAIRDLSFLIKFNDATMYCVYAGDMHLIIFEM